MTTQHKPPRPIVLCILDGWGHRDEPADNALAMADIPHYRRLWDTGARAFVKTSGLAVGLPDAQMGNSEVGHMNLGGGRVVLQDLPRIDEAFAAGELDRNPVFRRLVADLKASGGVCHLMGLLSPGGVHSHQDHMAALARALAAAGIGVRIHALLDGRDTPPKSAADYVASFEHALAGLDDVAIATVTGRYWAMDRDKRWDRVARAYAAIVDGDGKPAASAADAIAAAYDAGETDEFVSPTVIDGYTGMADTDGLIMANFRADRARQILTALLDPAFDGFTRPRLPAFAAKAGMVEYSTALNDFLPALFPPTEVRDSLGEVIARAGRTQLRIAETEKYAHVTFFFNGGEETVFDGEDRILVPSPRVATYDLQPEMSAPEVTDKLVDAVRSEKYDAIIVNYANPDMVGHTGVLDAAIKAVEAVDACLGRLAEAVEAVGGVLLITADHGNVEMMRDPDTGQPHTAHTTFDVPLVMANAQVATDGLEPGQVWGLTDGRLADVAPTVLALMGLKQPAAMTGKSLLMPVDDRMATVEAETRARA